MTAAPVRLVRLVRPAVLAAALAQLLIAAGPARAQEAAAGIAMPEAATGQQAKPGWATRHFAVAAANPLAVEAGYRILKAGGNALDAAIAVQMVLALVEPQSSGLGGGAFLMLWDGKAVQAWDGRETAPMAATPQLFLRPDGKPMTVGQAVVGGLSVATPGLVAMLAAAHREQGKLPWPRLLEPAIELAEQGFRISPRLHQLLSGEEALKRDPQAGPLYYDEQGRPRPVGHLLKNPALAAVLRAIAERGADGFYAGPVAADIARRVRGHARPGPLTEADLAAYRPRRREPLCADWLERWRVCGFPPPSSGQLTLMQILKTLEARGQAPAAPLVEGKPSIAWLHLYTEASRLAFADRAQYVADPDFVAAPAGDWKSLLDAAYLKQRAALIGAQSMKAASAGQPAKALISHAPQAAQPEYGTSHISIVDAEGRAVAMTSSIEAGFGSRIMSDGGTGLAGGFLLNNEMTDFSLAPSGADGKPVANRVEPGKRPRSSMSPTLVFDRRDGRLAMSVGAPGGPAIIHYVAKTLIGSLAWGMNLQQAVDLPNFGSFNGPTVLEQGGFGPATIAGLRALGHEVLEYELVSGLHAIQRTPGGWFGAADPRREGIVKGD
ncbi:gamma-glutamyltransferase [Roseateles violae]|uniref:Glutathione hydrolase proenzyme n=1 Tax=Roseateles violae TaxID=3058042 RepID=A0ABT8DQI8_9BURK|nr:gamma-glutamyltransferase [Pelomonas sp. PFR6]MDN3920223.1 gamma-glutamyltransferase [Pelomonas sp. PFR6]